MTGFDRRPLGMFDSGIGGLTVFKAVRNRLPHESIVYFGDTARFPYGGKSADSIIRYSLENANFLAEQSAKLLVVACNTASSFALEFLRERLDIPVIGVIQPGAEAALRISGRKRIAVLGTKGTIRSQVYERQIELLDPEAYVLSIPCPLLAPLIEEELIDHPATRLLLQEYLRPVQKHGIDTLLLGCTHYPLLKEIISRELGEGIGIVDSAASLADKLSEVLKANELSAHDGTLEDKFYVSDDPEQFQRLGQKFLGCAIPFVEQLPQFAS